MDIVDDRIEQAFREGYAEGQKETAELKRMLRLAMDTIKFLNYKVEELVEYSEFPCCKGRDCEECLMIPYSGDACVWKYGDEAEKLLGDKE